MERHSYKILQFYQICEKCCLLHCNYKNFELVQYVSIIYNYNYKSIKFDIKHFNNSIIMSDNNNKSSGTVGCLINKYNYYINIIHR